MQNEGLTGEPESERERLAPEDLRSQIVLLREELARQRQSQRRLRLAIDAALDHALVILDRENRIVDWNRGAEHLLGYNKSEIAGRSAEAFFTPDDRALGAVEQELATAFRNGRAEDERWHLRKDGTRFWGSGVLTPIHEDGVLTGFIKVFRDLTERKLSSERLRQSEEHFRLLVENITNCAVFELDAEDRILTWNPGAAKIFGYTASEVLGRPFSMFHSPQSGSGEKDQSQTWLVRQDGNRFYASWVNSPINDVSGSPLGTVRVLVDETRRKAEEELIARDRRMEREYLRSRVASTAQALDVTQEELRALTGNLISIQEEERRRIARELHDDLAQRLAMIEVGISRLRRASAFEASSVQQELGHLERLTSQLAHDVRGLSHQLHPAMLEDLGLAVALEGLADEFQISGTQEILFESEFAGAVPPPIAATVYRVAQEALRNVTKHAANSLVRMKLTLEADRVSLSIVDSGPGFDPAGAHRRGLGIVSMNERAQLVGGRVLIDSTEGQGTSVTVIVPLARS